jgi:hypothetical protein
MNSWSFARTAPDGGQIWHAGREVARVQELAVTGFWPVAAAPSLLTPEVGLPLWWRQYGNHQDPARSAHAARRLEVVAEGDDELRLRARSTTEPADMESEFDLVFRAEAEGRVFMVVTASLAVAPGPGWQVTPHPDHGEVTFATVWPAGVFDPAGEAPKRYQACLLRRGGRLQRIEHHHLESRDKQRIRLKPGDQFAWGVEDWNPVLTLGSGPAVEAGLCAYMWDAHFGLKLCPDGDPVLLPPGTRLTAAYQLNAAPRASLQPGMQQARRLAPGRAADRPVWTGGRHGFQQTFRSPGLDFSRAWPWSSAVLAGDSARVEFDRDCWTGASDRYALRIRLGAEARAAWMATTLGPAFGESAFVEGGRLMLSGLVRTDRLRGGACLRLRWHREGRGSVYDVAGYESMVSEESLGASEGWTALRVITPPLRPRPDRVHVLLEARGEGTVWFDDVEFARVD